jgi:hypothetical protein
MHGAEHGAAGYIGLRAYLDLVHLDLVGRKVIMAVLYTCKAFKKDTYIIILVSTMNLDRDESPTRYST